MNDSSPSIVIWDEKHIKALLGLHRHSARALQEEPWRTWVKEHGGLKNIIDHLRAVPLSSNQKQLLELILAHPDAPTVFYAGKLHISQSPYFVRLSSLVEALIIQLNNWTPEPANPGPTPTNASTSSAHRTSTLPVVAHRPDVPTGAHHLPSALTPLIGADESVAAVVAILRRPGVRLLTLMGPGGVGKTRLAIAVGDHLLEIFRDGVFFIPLETLNDPALLTAQVARSLNIETVGTQPLMDELKDYLRQKKILLILDNFEQLIQGAPLITDLLQAAGDLKILVTSREALNLYGENRFDVPELPWPDPENLHPLEQLNQWPAVELFVQRVQARHPAFVLTETNKEAVVGICNRLDGLPLAIELAAAQVKLLSPDQALPQLERGLKALKDAARDRPTRQKTLWDAIDWSYRLLPDAEKRLFRRLAVFGREWSLEAAQTVCETDEAQANLESLADKSLLRYAGQGENGALRFQMLQAVREYALDQLGNSAHRPDVPAGETKETQRRHANYFLEMVEQAEPTFGTPKQQNWMRRIKQDLENLQIALQWMLDEKETEMAFRLLGAVWRFYHMLNIVSETRLWMDRALAQGAQLKSAPRAKTLWGASWLVSNQGNYTQAMAFAEQGLALAREIGEKRLVGLLLQNVADGLCRLHQDYAQAAPLLEESLLIFRELEDREETAWVLARIAWIFWQSRQAARSKALLQESLDIFRAMGHQWAIATILRQLGALAVEDGDNQLAEALSEESLAISRAMGTKQRINEILRELASFRWRRGDFEQARAALEEGLAISREIGDQMGLGWTINFQGQLALEQANLAQARQFFEKAQAIFEKIGDQPSISHNLAFLERLALAEKGELEHGAQVIKRNDQHS